MKITSKPTFPILVSIFFAFLLSSASATIQAANQRNEIRNKAIVDSLMVELKNSKSPADSLDELVDIFDLIPRSERTELGLTAIDIAIRTRNSQIGLDMIRNVANVNHASDSMLNICSNLALQFPVSDNRDETVLFIDMFRNYNHVEAAKPSDRPKHLEELIETMTKNPPSNIYDKIRMLHAICVHIIDLPDDKLLSKYINALDSTINMLRPKAYALRHMFLVQASMAYNRSVFTSGKALEYDRRMLAGIDSLEKGSSAIKRKYRNYDANRYIIYTRMLSNFDSLSVEEAESLYRSAMRIVARDSLAASTNGKSLRPQIYIAMKRDEYKKAYDLLLEAVEMPYNKNFRPRMLKMILECALAIDDNPTVSWALNEYISILTQNMEEGTVNKWRELEILYDLKEMKEAFQNNQVAVESKMRTWSALAFSILSILLVILVILVIRSRKLAHNLAVTNSRLTTERDNLQVAKNEAAKARDEAEMANKLKNAFVKNITEEVKVPLQTISEYVNLIADNEDLQKRPYMKRYADMVELNSEMVLMMINDLAVLVDIDNGKIKPVIQKQSLKDVCKMAIASVRSRVSDGVTLKIAGNDEDNVMLYTDTHRLLHIMCQVLYNSAKFTKKGSIIVEYKLTSDRKHANIAIVDTGIGISKENAERIFRRFVKLDHSMPGAGIGLTLARSLVNLLGGTLVFVPTQSAGARFEINIPISL